MSKLVVIADGFDFPEGPTVAPDGAIWLSELRAGMIARVAPDRAITRFPVGGAPNGTTLAADGALWFCDGEQNAVRRLDPADGTTTTIIDAIDGDALASPNDLAFHADGSLLVSCPGDSRSEPTGYMCRWHQDGRLERVLSGLLFPNGVCFAPDGDRVYVAETYGLRVLGGAWEFPLQLEPVLTTPGPIGADGVAVSRAGLVATCVYGGGVVRLLDPATGTTSDIAVPDKHPAGIAIDPLMRWDLLITGTQRGELLGWTS